MSLIIGASGSIGKNLAKALAQRGDYVVAGLRKSPLPADLATMITAQEFGVDVREPETIKAVFAKHPQIKIVWNLAAPLSVETAKNPHVAHKIVVGGMENVLNAMDKSGVKRIVFSDSIGSLGATAPREECPASWLPANPQQDPGSDYGVQKRACRDLMRELGVKIRLRNLFSITEINFRHRLSSFNVLCLIRYTEKQGGDSRFAVIPGVLHSDHRWGAGTTEYALDAMQAAALGEKFICPVDPDVAEK